jgi:hypothetical protein
MPDQEFWKFFNTFAPWFSAIGSLSAVITTLYLARRDRRLNLSVRADYETLPILTTKTDEYRVDEESFVCITFTNHGRRIATVTGILWKVGVFKRRTWRLKFADSTGFCGWWDEGLTTSQ